MKSLLKWVGCLGFAASLALIGAITARADDHPWSGCYAEVHGGMRAAKNAISVEDVTADLGANAGIGGIGVGCDAQVGRLVLGGFGRYSWGASSADIASGMVAAKLDREWMVAARAGLAVTKSLMAYGLIGFARADNKLTFDDTSASAQPGGIVLGLGAEVLLDKNWSLKLEADWHRPQSQTITIADAFALKSQVEGLTALVGVSYRFPVEQPAALANVKPLM